MSTSVQLKQTYLDDFRLLFFVQRVYLINAFRWTGQALGPSKWLTHLHWSLFATYQLFFILLQSTIEPSVWAYLKGNGFIVTTMVLAEYAMNKITFATIVLTSRLNATIYAQFYNEILEIDAIFKGKFNIRIRQPYLMWNNRIVIWITFGFGLVIPAASYLIFTDLGIMGPSTALMVLIPFHIDNAIKMAWSMSYINCVCIVRKRVQQLTKLLLATVDDDVGRHQREFLLYMKIYSKLSNGISMLNAASAPIICVIILHNFLSSVISTYTACMMIQSNRTSKLPAISSWCCQSWVNILFITWWTESTAREIRTCQRTFNAMQVLGHTEMVIHNFI